MVPSNRGEGGEVEGGQAVVSIMYAECVHILDDSNTSACHRRHQFYLVTALRANPYEAALYELY